VDLAPVPPLPGEAPASKQPPAFIPGPLQGTAPDVPEGSNVVGKNPFTGQTMVAKPGGAAAKLEETAEGRARLWDQYAGHSNDPETQQARQNYILGVKSGASTTPTELALKAVQGDAKAKQALALLHPGMTAGDLDDNAMDIVALTYLKTGAMPNLGMGAQDLRKSILNRAGQLSNQAGTSPDEVVANRFANKADAASLNRQTAMLDAVTAFENTADKNLQMFLTTAKPVVDSGSPLLNRPLRAVATAGLGSQELAAYNAARQVAVVEVGRVLNNPNLVGVLSDTAREEVSRLIKPDATLGQVYAAANILRQDMQNRKGAVQQQVGEIRNRIQNRGRIGPQATTPPPNNPPPAPSAPKLATMAHIREYAQQKGISVQQATDEAQKAGYTIGQ
jgi:hypothetical protein